MIPTLMVSYNYELHISSFDFYIRPYGEMIKTGTSGFYFPDWKGTVYPERNPRWFNSSISERYNYLYSDEELKEFVPESVKMDSRARKVYTFFNNCHAGFALRNA